MSEARKALAKRFPDMPEDRVRHWADVIEGEVLAGRYTAARQWEIAAEIVAERSA